MIVLDASAAIEMLLSSPAGIRLAARLESSEGGIHAPHLIDLEIGQTLRKYVISRVVDERVGTNALDQWLSLDIERYPHHLLLGRVWQLRANVSAYDAVYIALAEALGTTLLTADDRLSRVPGLQAVVDLIQ